MENGKLTSQQQQKHNNMDELLTENKNQNYRSPSLKHEEVKKDGNGKTVVTTTTHKTRKQSQSKLSNSKISNSSNMPSRQNSKLASQSLKSAFDGQTNEIQPGSNFTVDQDQSEKINESGKEANSSSNYEASIFEDDGDTSSDNMDDSDKQSRQSLGNEDPTL